MRRILFILGLSLTCNSVIADSYSLKEILNTKIDYQKNNEQVDNKELHKFCIYSSRSYPCYEQNDSKNGFLNWQENLRNLERDRQTLYLGTNRLYSILTKDYGLNSKVSCRIYRAKDYSDEEFKNFKKTHPYLLDPTMPLNQKLGEENQKVMLMDSSLNRDIFNELINISMINSPNLTPEKKKYYIYMIQQRHRFIEKSCGDKFIAAYNKYLDDYGKYAAEIQNNELAQQRAKELESDQVQSEKIKQKNELEQKQNEYYEAQQQKAADKRIAWSKCFKSNDYLIFETSNKIVNSIDAVNTGKELLKHDDANVKVGGVSDLNLRYRASSMITNGNEQIKYSFSEYKKLGGKASTPYQVTKIKDSPCRWQ